MDDATMRWLIGGGVAVIVWAVRVESKVLAHDRELSQMRADMAQRVADLKGEMGEVLSEVKYIRQRLDDWMGKR